MMKETVFLQQDIQLCFEANILSRELYVNAYQEAEKAFQKIAYKAQNHQYPFLELPFKTDDLSLLKEAAEYFQRFQTVLIIGTGGSSLGGRALCALLQSWILTSTSFPRLHFLDNLDPETFWEVMSVANPKTTGVLAISKSGETPEILIQVMRCLEYWNGLLDKKELAERFWVITENTQNRLRKIAIHFRLKCLDHPSNIGGRFSCFSLTSLLPAMIIGFDAKKFRQGAARTCNQVFLGKLKIPIEGVALMWALYKKNEIKTHVLFPYGDAFAPLVLWYRQLWAESLGKNGCGFTPVDAMGPIDQHSQLQLYLDGPKDKFFTILLELQVAREKLSPEMWSALPQLKEFAYHAIADLVQAQCKATCHTLAKRQQPIRILRVQTLNEETLGALMMNFMLEVLIMAQLLDVDPFTQPMVEEGKILAKKFLNNTNG